MKIITLAGALGLALLSSAALAQEAGQGQPTGGVASPLDRQFAGRASASNTFEVASSRIALRKSRDPAVRDLARWMIEDHTMAEHKLQAAATYEDDQGGAAPVVGADMADTLASLGTLDGADFDKAYVAAQVDAHVQTAQQMRDYMQTGSYGPLLTYDAKTLPHVEEHLAHFQGLQAMMSRNADS